MMRLSFLLTLPFLFLLPAPWTLANPSTAKACYADCSGDLNAENDRGPRVGEAAPDFRALAYRPGQTDTTAQSLRELLDGRPLILAFGSYT